MRGRRKAKIWSFENMMIVTIYDNNKVLDLKKLGARPQTAMNAKQGKKGQLWVRPQSWKIAPPNWREKRDKAIPSTAWERYMDKNLWKNTLKPQKDVLYSNDNFMRTQSFNWLTVSKIPSKTPSSNPTSLITVGYEVNPPPNRRVFEDLCRWWLNGDYRVVKAYCITNKKYLHYTDNEGYT